MTKHILDYSHSKQCETCGATFYRDKRCTWKWWAQAKFCSRGCSAKAGVKKIRVRIPSLEVAFYAKALVGKDGECWGWSGVRDKDGYALVTFNGKQYRAARVAVEITGRSFSQNDQACHSCGNLRCVNPSHIYPGSPKRNNADKVLHGTQLRGEQCHMAKLTGVAVREIRRSNMSNSALAKRFGVTSGAVAFARSGKTWKHIK